MERRPIKLKKDHLDHACRVYLTQRGVISTYWHRAREDSRDHVRREVMGIIALATSRDVQIDEGE